MHPVVLAQLRLRTSTIREHWEALLRVEPVSGPLANPDTLVNLIPHSLGEILTTVARPLRGVHAIPPPRDCLPDCHCGNNPYLAFFIAGEQALVEAVVLIQAEQPPLDRRPGDVAEIKFAVRRLARSEIDAFCGVCVHRGTAAGCRHELAAG